MELMDIYLVYSEIFKSYSTEVVLRDLFRFFERIFWTFEFISSTENVRNHVTDIPQLKTIGEDNIFQVTELWLTQNMEALMLKETIVVQRRPIGPPYSAQWHP